MTITLTILRQNQKICIWTQESIEENRYLFRNNKLEGNYKKSSVDEISRHIDEHMLEKVCVIECYMFVNRKYFIIPLMLNNIIWIHFS